jgi:uncharacterized BrkB/YihY/UPF0761 family membrane protein
MGKLLISLYLGSSTIASSYGAAGSLIVVLLWIYYSAQIFLFGPELRRSMRAIMAATNPLGMNCCNRIARTYALPSSARSGTYMR